jgi:two-component system sensor histidine kinase KdpD
MFTLTASKRQYYFSVIAVILVSIFGFLLTYSLDYRITAFLLLVTVSFLAMFYDIAPVLLSAFLSALIWDFFFIPPRFTFAIGTTEDRLLLLMYFIIASVNAALTFKIRQYEKEVTRKENEEKAIKFYSTLLNTLSHELRTPISTVIAATDNLLSNNKTLSDEIKSELVNEISSAAIRLNSHVENLLNMSRIESGNVVPRIDWCDVNELVYSALHKIEDTGSHRILVHIREKLPLVKLDFVLIEHVLINLIKNAVLYTQDDSIITIEADCRKILPGHSKVLDQVVSNLIISVTDNGSGFPEDEIENVFEKFYRLKGAKPGGTGLGLSIVKGFVEVHNGIVGLENITSGGARLLIQLPVEISELEVLKNE